MSEIFLKIVNMSISACWLVPVVLLLRLLFKKAPKWVNVLLWGIVALRLICLFSFESALSLIPSAETISPTIMMDQAPSVNTGIPALNSAINPVISDSFTPAPGASSNPFQIWIPILSIIWLIGVAILILYTAISYLRLRGKISEAVILRDNIYQSENVASPFVLGIIKPKIYLPYKMDEQDLCHVVAHEQAHIRRKDHWWKPLGFLLLIIHWFNPLMWLAYVLLCRDIELACDEKVIKELGNEQRADYTQALVACSVKRRVIAACPLAFGEVGVKERVKSVMNYKKPAFWVIVLAVIACVVVAVCFLTNPKNDEPDNLPLVHSHSYGVDNGITAASGENVIPVVVFPVGTSLSDIKDGIHWLDIAQGADDMVPFTILCDGKEKYGWYDVYDAETMEALDFMRPSGLSPQTYLFQNAKHGHDYIVTLSIEEGDLLCFGARIGDSADSVSVATKWFDYLGASNKLSGDDCLEIKIPEFPEVTFRWYPEKVEAVSEGKTTLLYTGLPIWNTYFCDLTGDGLPELCSTISWGSGIIDKRIIIYDYANGVSYSLVGRMVFDYTLRQDEGNGQLYVDKKKYPDYLNGEPVSSGRLALEDGSVKIIPPIND